MIKGQKLEWKFLSGFCLLFLLATVGCKAQSPQSFERLVIGVVAYDEGVEAIKRYEGFQDYLTEQISAFVELEPTLNERQAITQIRRQKWSIVFAPPGVAAIAVEAQYKPIFAIAGSPQNRSVIVVLDGSPLQELADLSNQTLALGPPGSIAGYYLPLHDLNGLTLAEIKLTKTPAELLAAVANQTVDAGALSLDQFSLLRQDFVETRFRILHRSRVMPKGSVLISPEIDRIEEEQILRLMRAASPIVISDTGYLIGEPVPNYEEMIELIDEVQPLEAKVRQKPAVISIDP